MITLDARLTALSSPDLLAALERTAALGREVTADLIALLAECDARQLYAAEGYGSLFEFCVARLRLSEAQAYHRIQAARAAQRFPLVLERVREGRVTMTAVALLRQHLTEENHREVLDWAEGRAKREVEMYVRRLDPQPDVPASIRRLATPRARPPVAAAAERQAAAASALTAALPAPPEAERPTGPSLPLLVAPPGLAAIAGVAGSALGSHQRPAAAKGAALVGTKPPVDDPAAASWGEIRPLAPARYSLHVTISEETSDKLRRAQDLLRHTLPTADIALVLDRALTLFVARLERRKAGAPAKPGPSTRPNGRATAATRPHATGSTEPEDRDAPDPATREGVSTGVNDADETPVAVARADGGQALAPPFLQPCSLDSTKRRQGRSRYIPAAVRRAVWDRDGARCAYVSRSGVRCGASAALEFHHRVPFAEGGASTVENLALACARHNAFEAKRWFNSDQTESEGWRRSADARAGT